MHDDTLERTTNGRGLVREFVYPELLRLDAGLGRSIPLLTDVLDQFGAALDVQFCIELKERGFAAEIRNLVLSRNLSSRTVVSAFDLNDADPSESNSGWFSSWDDLAVLKPEIRIALLASSKKIAAMGESRFVGESVERGASAVNPDYIATTESLVSLVHGAGLMVNVWTVNTLARYEHLMEIGADNVFCDNPYFLTL
jgi:glycerophosphoryl diester phosphodiesterase